MYLLWTLIWRVSNVKGDIFISSEGAPPCAPTSDLESGQARGPAPYTAAGRSDTPGKRQDGHGGGACAAQGAGAVVDGRAGGQDVVHKQDAGVLQAVRLPYGEGAPYGSAKALAGAMFAPCVWYYQSNGGAR